MKNQRLKRRLLRQAVTTNVDLIQGAVPVPLRRSRRIVRRTVRTLVLLVLPLSLASSYVIATGTLDEPQFIPVPQAIPPAMTPVSLTLPAETDVESTLTFPEPPKPVDREALPLGIRKIVLDPGHGGENSGTVTPLGLEEKDITLDLAHRLRALLTEASYEVAMTRKNDRGVSLQDRVAFANAVGGDIFISIHVNWIETRNVRGVETYYLGTTDDPYLNRLARAENRESGYSLGDYRRLLEGIIDGVRQTESKQLARAVQASLFRSLRRVNPGLQDRGVKTAPFVVLVGTEIPAILAEVSCLSNNEEARLLQKPRYRQFIAQALFDGIHSYAQALNPSSEKGTS